MAKKYFSLNEVPIGTKMIIKSTKDEVELIEIQNFPTTFIVKSHDGKINKHLTHEVDVLGWPKEN